MPLPSVAKQATRAILRWTLRLVAGVAVLALATTMAVGLAWATVPHKEMRGRDMALQMEDNPRINAMFRHLTQVMANVGTRYARRPEEMPHSNALVAFFDEDEAYSARPQWLTLDDVPEERGQPLLTLIKSEDVVGNITHLYVTSPGYSIPGAALIERMNSRLLPRTSSMQSFAESDIDPNHRIYAAFDGTRFVVLEYRPEADGTVTLIIEVITEQDPRFATRNETYGVSPGHSLAEKIKEDIELSRRARSAFQQRQGNLNSVPIY
ncbi:MAG: hypothetical protein RLY93_09275 [Sumerlaeia bacterium]